MMPPLNAWPPLHSIFWRIKLSRKYWIILSSQPIPLPCHHTYMCICPFISFTSFPFPIQLFNQPFKCNLMYCIHWSYQVIHTEQTKCSLEYNLMNIPIQSVWVNLSFHFKSPAHFHLISRSSTIYMVPTKLNESFRNSTSPSVQSFMTQYPIQSLQMMNHSRLWSYLSCIPIILALLFDISDFVPILLLASPPNIILIIH